MRFTVLDATRTPILKDLEKDYIFEVSKELIYRNKVDKYDLFIFGSTNTATYRDISDNLLNNALSFKVDNDNLTGLSSICVAENFLSNRSNTIFYSCSGRKNSSYIDRSIMESLQLAKDYNINNIEIDYYIKKMKDNFILSQQSGAYSEEITSIVDSSKKLVSKDYYDISNISANKFGYGADFLKSQYFSSNKHYSCSFIFTSLEFCKVAKLIPLGYISDYIYKISDKFNITIAIKELLEKNNLTLNDIDLFEVDDSSAITSLALIKQIKRDISLGFISGEFDADMLNISGGSLALGSSYAISSMQQLVHTFYELKRRGKRRAIVVGLEQKRTIAMLVEV